MSDDLEMEIEVQPPVSGKTSSKKKKKEEAPPPPSFMQNVIRKAAAAFGENAAICADEYEKTLLGIPCGPLMLQRLFGIDKLPVGLIIELFGPSGSAKSAIAQFLSLICLTSDAYVVYVETEKKYSPSLHRSIVGSENYGKITIIPDRTSQEKWQAATTLVLNEYKKTYDQLKAVYRNGKRWADRPLFIFVDSLQAAAQATIDKINQDGYASKQYPAEAGNNKTFFSQLPDQLRGYPITLIYTNHEKHTMEEGIKKGGFAPKPEKMSKGGDSHTFYSTYRISFDEIIKPKERSRGKVFTQMVKMTTVKNALNQKGVKVKVPMTWTIGQDEEGNKTQTTVFDWEESLARFLMPVEGEPEYSKAEVHKFLCVTKSSQTKYSCKELKLVNVPPGEIGKAVMADPELVRKLQPYMNITRIRGFDYEEPL